MKIYLLAVVVFIFDFTYSINKDSRNERIEIEISNFNKKAPNCGIISNISVYKAIRNQNGFKSPIIIYMRCQEVFNVIGNKFYAEVSEFQSSSDGSVYDFTELSDSEKRMMLKYEVLKLVPVDTK